ncbi:hypothetical protein BX600DRAFT_157981 [Xylariales sp. PMI_506]|nr:hypothetical protein BX600DRAFT_157981 [Xylariales sp. PMI_506]
MNNLSKSGYHKDSALAPQALDLRFEIQKPASSQGINGSRENVQGCSTGYFEPLHPQHRTRLMGYLTYCWDLFVRCDMMAKALGDQIPWDKLVSWSLADLWMRQTAAGDNDTRKFYDLEDRHPIIEDKPIFSYGRRIVFK